MGGHLIGLGYAHRFPSLMVNHQQRTKEHFLRFPQVGEDEIGWFASPPSMSQAPMESIFDITSALTSLQAPVGEGNAPGCPAMASALYLIVPFPCLSTTLF